MLTKGQNNMTTQEKEVAIYVRVNDPSKVQTAKRAAIYARSATVSQKVTGMASIDQQVAEGCQHCAERGYVLEEGYIYQEIIGGKRERNRSYLPQLDALRRAAKKHEFDILVIRSIDRLALETLFRAVILAELEKAGITIECTNGEDLDDEGTKMIEAIMEQGAQMERQNISKRTQHGKAVKKTQREQL